jgi:molybdate transport system ATP-binding protein
LHRCRGADRRKTLLTANVVRTFKNGAGVRVSVDIDAASQVTVLFGPSGAGKTTILRCIAGLDKLDGGRIVFKERVWADAAQGVHLPPQQRPVGYLFQDYALFPHLSVRRNIAYGIHELKEEERESRVRKIAASLQVEDLLDRQPSGLSGGEQQRVALARSLVRNPELLLLDEPLSALDGPTRERVRSELARLLRTLQVPAILVTHDWIDALSLGDRLVVMNRGSVLQTGEPAEVFARPQHAEVAAAVGMETVLSGSVKDRLGGSLTLQVGGAELVAVDPQDGQSEYFICIRGENITLETGRAGQSSARNHLRGIVKEISPAGTLWKVVVDVGADLVALLTRQALEDMSLKAGAEVYAVFKASAVHLIGRSAPSRANS